MVYTHHIQQRHRELKKMAAMRAHNIGFLQAKPLARVMPGHLLLLVRFQFVRCPFQTEHLHLGDKEKTQQDVEASLEQVVLQVPLYFIIVQHRHLSLLHKEMLVSNSE